MDRKLILNPSYFWEEWLKTMVILQRPAVQLQLFVITISLLVMFLISQWIWSKFKQRFPDISQFEDKNEKRYYQQCGAALFYYLLFPIFSLITIHLIRLIFLQRGLFAGYLADTIDLLWIYIIYRIFLVALYSLLNHKTVESYHHRFFAPLFLSLIVLHIINILTDFDTIFRVSFFRLFDQSVTLGDIVVTVGGLYFWITGCTLFEKVLIYLFSKEIRTEQRAVQSISLILRYFLIGLGITLIFGYVGISPTALAAVTGGLSVGIGFGLKEVISNFISGLFLLFEGALKPDDVISINDDMSQVKKFGIRAKTVQVIRDNSEKIIPNQTFFTQEVTTFTGSDPLVYRSVVVGANYNCDPQQVIKVLLEVADQNPNILEYPRPVAFALNFGDSSIDFELKFLLDDPLIGKRVTSSLICDIWKAFKKNNIEIPYPQRDLHIINAQN
ncbi:MAG: mechanosensitive ion channel [Crocosphaera sp.]|uniref:mechanosensitive ion channel family protein n=1 Tax=Crocosphaera sp. TaxID=2729996 RepID=UPI00258BC04B|nr:mechanosensitive ion channel domain-containing protein [Crocosphaera sp.]MCH2246900.1 mechanosensitive ion channel [Crocosphaera sp.]